MYFYLMVQTSRKQKKLEFIWILIKGSLRARRQDVNLNEKKTVFSKTSMPSCSKNSTELFYKILQTRAAEISKSRPGGHIFR